MNAFYNEIESYAADWLENLCSAGYIANGVVERRSIVDLQPKDVAKFTQAHFFAGIGIWSHALRLAGVPDDFNVWTGSCPCQPFSVAGKGEGVDDERHLWPDWFKLIDQCRPAAVLGEQVASKPGLAWLDAVRTDLEGAGYAFGASDLASAGVGAPHIRQRLYFCAFRLVDSSSSRSGRDARAFSGTEGSTERSVRSFVDEPVSASPIGGLGNNNNKRLEIEHGVGGVLLGPPPGNSREAVERAGASVGATRGFWADADWLPCRDGKWRPVESMSQQMVDGVATGLGCLRAVDINTPFPLAIGAQSRVGRLRGYGNALCAPLAVEFIRSAFEAFTEITTQH